MISLEIGLFQVSEAISIIVTFREGVMDCYHSMTRENGVADTNGARLVVGI